MYIAVDVVVSMLVKLSTLHCAGIHNVVIRNKLYVCVCCVCMCACRCVCETMCAHVYVCLYMRTCVTLLNTFPNECSTCPLYDGTVVCVVACTSSTIRPCTAQLRQLTMLIPSPSLKPCEIHHACERVACVWLYIPIEVRGVIVFIVELPRIVSPFSQFTRLEVL